MSTRTRERRIPRPLVALRVSSVLAAAAALLAAAAGVGGLAGLPATGSATLFVEVWRVVGFFTFAAVFALLAIRPLISPGLWLIVIANKLALSIAGVALAGRAAGSLQAVPWDGALVVLLGAGFATMLVARARERST